MKFYAVKSGRKTGIFESWDECRKSVSGYSGAIYKSFKTYSEAREYLGAAGKPEEKSDNTDPVKKERASLQVRSSEDELPGEGLPTGDLSGEDLPGDDSYENDVSGEDSSDDDPAEEEENGELKKPGRKKKRFPKIRDRIETGRVDTYVLTEAAKAYVDGSYLEATGEFSYGCVVLLGDTEIRLYEKLKDEELSSMHNVAGEIKGAEAAMRFAVANGITDLTIYHDYEGIARWCTGEWTPRKSGTIAYSNFYQDLPKGLRVRFVKVQGHSGDTYNELADRLAKQALGIPFEQTENA